MARSTDRRALDVATRILRYWDGQRRMLNGAILALRFLKPRLEK
jgi:hypothetical protein